MTDMRPLPDPAIGGGTPVERLTLFNGLRVVIRPVPHTRAVSVAVTYDVGFRPEPVGQTSAPRLPLDRQPRSHAAGYVR